MEQIEQKKMSRRPTEREKDLPSTRSSQHKTPKTTETRKLKSRRRQREEPTPDN